MIEPFAAHQGLCREAQGRGECVPERGGTVGRDKDLGEDPGGHDYKNDADQPFSLARISDFKTTA